LTGHVFISHGSEDAGEANALSAFIEGKGVKAWIAPRDVRPGQDYSEQLQEAIETCIAFVVLVTDKANKSPYVRAETEMAFSTSKPIFPVRMSDIQPAAGLAFFLKIRHWTNAWGPDREGSLARLARELQTAAGVPVDPAPQTTAPPIAPTAPPAYTPPAPPPPPPPPPPAVAPAPLMSAPAQPQAQPQPQAPAAPPPDEDLLRAAIGPNADFYLNRWAQMDAKNSAINWNWPACLLSAFWFAYRKMWLPMIGIMLLSFVLSLIGAGNPALGKAMMFLTIGLTFVTGAFGNHLYRKQTLGLIAQTAPLGRKGQIDALASRGGTSKAAVFVLIGLTVVATLIAMIAAMAEIRRQQEAANMLAPTQQNFTDPNQQFQPTNNGGKPPLPPEEQQQQSDYFQESY